MLMTPPIAPVWRAQKASVAAVSQRIIQCNVQSNRTSQYVAHAGGAQHFEVARRLPQHVIYRLRLVRLARLARLAWRLAHLGAPVNKLEPALTCGRRSQSRDVV